MGAGWRDSGVRFGLVWFLSVVGESGPSVRCESVACGERLTGAVTRAVRAGSPGGRSIRGVRSLEQNTDPSETQEERNR